MIGPNTTLAELAKLIRDLPPGSTMRIQSASPRAAIPDGLWEAQVCVLNRQAEDGIWISSTSVGRTVHEAVDGAYTRAVRSLIERTEEVA